jgi:putative chitinase
MSLADAIGDAVDDWHIPLRDTLALNEIDSDRRVAFFLANCLYETDRFTKLREDMHYSAARLLVVFPKYFTPAEAIEFAYDEERIASRVYANRLGNADEASGEGWRFRAGGLLGITGRTSFRQASVACGVDLEKEPERIVEPFYACLSAGWFWTSRGLNEVADTGDFVAVVRRINGGTNGLAERQTYLQQIEAALTPRLG